MTGSPEKTAAAERIDLPGGYAFTRAHPTDVLFELRAPDGCLSWTETEARAFAAAIASASKPAVPSASTAEIDRLIELYRNEIGPTGTNRLRAAAANVRKALSRPAALTPSNVKLSETRFFRDLVEVERKKVYAAFGIGPDILAEATSRGYERHIFRHLFCALAERQPASAPVVAGEVERLELLILSSEKADQAYSERLSRYDWRPDRAHLEGARNAIRTATDAARKLAELARAQQPAAVPAETDPATLYARRVTMPYTNWRGKFSEREIAPIRLFWGSNEWHTEPQWLVEAWDIAKSEIRTFALSGFGRTAIDAAGGVRVADLTNLRDAIAFFDKVKNATQDEQIAVGTDHWDRLERAVRSLIPAAPAPNQDGER